MFIQGNFISSLSALKPCVMFTKCDKSHLTFMTVTKCMQLGDKPANSKGHILYAASHNPQT